jgi:hypothetical protein
MYTSAPIGVEVISTVPGEVMHPLAATRMTVAKASVNGVKKRTNLIINLFSYVIFKGHLFIVTCPTVLKQIFDKKTRRLPMQHVKEVLTKQEMISIQFSNLLENGYWY